MKVKLKTEKLKGGRRSLFLNICLGKGRYTQKSLKLYLIPEKIIDDKTITHQFFMKQTPLEMKQISRF